MKIVEIVKNSWRLLIKSYRYLWKHPKMLIFPFCALATFLLLEALFFILFYWKFNIHVFDESTLEHWALVSVWEFGFFALLTIGPIYFLSAIIAQVVKLSLAHSIKQSIHNQPISIIENFKYSLKELPDLTNFALLTTLVSLTIEPGLHRYIKRKIRSLGGTAVVPHKNIHTWKERTFLVMPLVGFKDETTPCAVQHSGELMTKKFGSIPAANFNFMYLMWLGILLFGIGTERIVSHFYHGALGVVSFIAILCVVMVFCRAGEAIFQTVTYLFCTDQPTGIFTKHDFKEAFSSNTDSVTSPCKPQ